MHYLGIDVAKAKLDCCLLLELPSGKRKTKSFSNNDSGFAELVHWLDRQRVSASDTHAVMEGTGVYHERTAITLHDAGMKISIINPAQVRDFAKGLAIRSKTDGLDSLVLARYGALVQPTIWIPPTPQARALQALLSRVEAVHQDLIREQNRQEKADATDTPELIRQSLADSIMFLQTQLKKLQQDIDDHINRHSELRDDVALLVTIPGVGIKTSQHLLSVMHLHQFPNAERLAAYLGVIPIQRQSGSSVLGRPKLSKTGPSHIRAVLYMAAVVATKHNPHVKALYERLIASGKSKMSALGAAMRKLVHLCFGVIKNRQPYSKNYS
ncbi:IS110 family transposase [Aeromonas enteropelogenes]|uniref:Transposase n=1 Tax=Aeromonas enteropelogenes TaxID=29489 RepID=A0A139UZN8_AEREN|nr:IS110 family transposase [Aeromonas enteropelogenes]KXU82021.1 transposase [Aeromonas enteropelogenes]